MSRGNYTLNCAELCIVPKKCLQLDCGHFAWSIRVLLCNLLLLIQEYYYSSIIYTLVYSIIKITYTSIKSIHSLLKLPRIICDRAHILYTRIIIYNIANLYFHQKDTYSTYRTKG